MNHPCIRSWSFLLAGILAVSACGLTPADEGDEATPTREGEPALGETEQQAVTLALLQSRSNAIKAAHASHPNIHNPLIFAGIAYAETQMAHCYYSEYVQYVGTACPGPYSSDCGGAVTAGGADGPCYEQDGGVGMWQFDEPNSTYSQTVNYWATTGYWGRTHNILSVSDSSAAAIDFALAKAWGSIYTPSFSTPQDMYNWMNSIRIGTAAYENWLGFLANSYNGWGWGTSGWSAAKDRYRNATSYVYNTLGGDAYWYGSGGSTQPPGQPTGLYPDGWISMPSGSVTLSWNAVAGATSYEVYILYATASGWTYYYTYYPTTNYVTIWPYYHGTSYAWNVKAKNSAGTGPQSSWAYWNQQ